MAEDICQRIRDQIAALKRKLPQPRRRTKAQQKNLNPLQKQLKWVRRRKEGMQHHGAAKQMQYLYGVNRKKCIQRILEEDDGNVPKHCPLSKQQIKDFYVAQQAEPHAYSPQAPP